MISIVIPVWKTQYLEQAIDSVLKQSHSDFELVIVESRRLADFNTILSKFPDSRIHVKRHEPMPIVENWNKCMAYAKGVFSILLCDDDMFAEDHLELLNKLAGKYPGVDLFHSRIRIMDHLGRLNSVSPSCSEYEPVHDFIWMKEQYKRPQYVSDFMFRTSRFREIGGFQERPMAWFTDVDTAYAMAAPNGVAFSNKPTFLYRNSEQNISSNLKPRQALEAVRLHYRFLEENLNHFTREAEEHERLIRHHLPQWREKAYAGAYTRTGIGRFPLFPLMNALHYRKLYPISIGRALEASAYAMVQKLNKQGVE